MTDHITLYELAFKTLDHHPGFSPHVWKNKFDLALLGVKYEPRPTSFSQLEHQLRIATGDQKTALPTIEARGEFISDSWAIAEYLEEKFGSAGKSLFGSRSGREYAKFLNTWLDTAIREQLKPLISGKVYTNLDSPSLDYLIRTRFNGDKSAIEPFIANLTNPEVIQSVITKSRAALQILETTLASRKTGKSPSASSKWISGGEEPNHADACVFGWYAHSRLNDDLVKGVWESDELPNIKGWVEAVLASGLFKLEELPSDPKHSKH